MEPENKVLVLLYAVAEIHSLCLNHSRNGHKRLAAEGDLQQAIADICGEVVARINEQEPEVARKWRMMASEKKQYMYLWGDVVSRGNGETQQVTRYSPDKERALRCAKKRDETVERIVAGKSGVATELWPE